jgi:uncharacterized RDD family membrane protein YckC
MCSGPLAVGHELPDPSGRPGVTAAGRSPQAFRGEQLGLPASGRGALAAAGPRLGALVVDIIASALVAAAFVAIARPHTGSDGTSRLPGSWSLIPFALDYVIGLVLGGRTLGMYLFGIMVVRVERPGPISVLTAAGRTVLLALLVPAVIWDRDGRGLHDRLTSTAVVNA